jgi:hypothetical protein
MPNPKQMEKLAEEAQRRAVDQDAAEGVRFADSQRDDLRIDTPVSTPARNVRLADLPQPILRVSCRRCGRLVEIAKADALRLYGEGVGTKEVAQRVLDNTCVSRTGRHEEDGCWPSLELA